MEGRVPSRPLLPATQVIAGRPRGCRLPIWRGEFHLAHCRRRLKRLPAGHVAAGNSSGRDGTRPSITPVLHSPQPPYPATPPRRGALWRGEFHLAHCCRRLKWLPAGHVAADCPSSCRQPKWPGWYPALHNPGLPWPNPPYPAIPPYPQVAHSKPLPYAALPIRFAYLLCATDN